MFSFQTLFGKMFRRKIASVLPSRDVLLENTSYTPAEILYREARDYLQLLLKEHHLSDNLPERLAEIEEEIAQTGTYQQTNGELSYGARVAWRNSARCIGRLPWQTLTVHDMRHLSTEKEIFQALLNHIRFATNDGKIRSAITVFSPADPGKEGIRIWNPQLIRYAGYRQEDRTIVGDPAQVEITDILRDLGWHGGNGTQFDVLPLIIQLPHRPPQLFELPSDLVLEVPLSHPDYAWFADLNLKWHALPVISNMRMEIGGLSYTAAPFNGWYMGTEIGARNLGDLQRYNLLPLIAAKMGLDTRTDRTLWRDRALIELNIAVLSSFAERKVTIVDHHTASRQFILHETREKLAGRNVPAQWAWLVPPLSGSISPLFHITTYKNSKQKPNFFYQSSPWQTYRIHSEHQCPHVHEKNQALQVHTIGTIPGLSDPEKCPVTNNSP